MSTSSISGGNSGGRGDLESMVTQLKVAGTRRENIRQTLESIHSQSNSLLLLALQWKDLEDYFDSIWNSIATQVEEVKLKSQQVEWRKKYLEKKLNDIELKEKKLEESLRMADDRCKEIDVTYELVGKCYRIVKEKEMHCDDEMEWVRSKEEGLRDYKCHLKRKYEKKEMKLECRELWVENYQHELEMREKRLGSIERKLLERLEEIELNEKRLKERVYEFELKQKEFQVVNDVRVKTEPFYEYDDGVLVDPSYADLKFNVTMDGRALQMFLNGRVNDHEMLRDEVIAGLRLSSDPAKLLLDAIEGFYPDVLANGDVGFDLNVVRKSCILLLEQLIKLKPHIKTHIRERAMRVAIEWKGKMKVDDDDHYLEVVGFLQLVATYGLTAGFIRTSSCSCLRVVPGMIRPLSCAAVLVLQMIFMVSFKPLFSDASHLRL